MKSFTFCYLLFLESVVLAGPPQAPRPPQAPPLDERVAELERQAVLQSLRLTLVERQLALYQPAAPAVAPASGVVPPGMHAHRTVDGRVIVHADSNFGSAAAHVGVAYPWPKIAVAGQPIYGLAPVASGCPGGVCPTETSRGRIIFRNR